MRFFTILGIVAFGCVAARSAQAAHTKARLVVEADSAPAGQTVLAGIVLEMEPGWHTYWKNPGGSGIPTKIEWHLPPGIKAGDIQWPIPEKLVEEDFTTYIYNKQAVLLVPLQLASSLLNGRISVEATVTWLECNVQCVPGKTDVSTSINIGSETKTSKDAGLLLAAEKAVPKPPGSILLNARWEKAAAGDLRPLLLEWNAGTAVDSPDFFPEATQDFEIQGPSEQVPSPNAHEVVIRKQVKKLAGDWPREISGIVVQTSGGDRRGYAIKAGLKEQAAVASSGLWQMLAYGFLGGLILNVMPCVLPVIALKILGFVSQAREDPRRIRRLGLLYCLGVLISFLLLAAMVIGIKAAGHRAGWGMQFANPEFLVVFTILVTLVALNLFGVFEVNLSGRVMGAAGTLASRHGGAGAFFNGVLATVLATPCTAPFLSIALGFAFAQSAAIIALVFLAIGFGLAFPYVLLSWHPAWLKLLPKPGPWMERFKIAMGFPMLATALWLLSLLDVHYGERTWWLSIFLVVLALSAWLFGLFVQRGGARRGLGVVAAVTLLLLGYAFILEGRLHWRMPAGPQANGGLALKNHPQGFQWQSWSPENVAAARAQGRPVLVDFYADWCITCNGIVKPALEDPRVRDLVQKLNAVPLLGDYTRSPPAITDELNRYQRAGVPLVLVFPGDPTKQAIVLPDPSPLRPPSHYSDIVLNALETAAK